MFHGDLLQRVCNGTSQVLGVAGFPLQDDAERENRLRLFLQRDFPDDYRNFKCTWDLME